MKRSEINAEFAWGKNLLNKNNIRLPDRAYWTMDEWKARKAEIGTIAKTTVGWDITDYGTGKYLEIGAVLYTLRNGKQDDPTVGVPYCEKYILMRDGQRLPKHYHVFKTEDIINRAGGVLEVMLWNTDADGKELATDVTVFMDGIKRTFKAGEKIRVTQGNSITLTPHIAHIFGPEAGSGDIVVGEVSKVNDDTTDNYFMEPTSFFAQIEEDVPAEHPLTNEYGRL